MVGSYELMALFTPFPALLSENLPQVSHLLGAGTAVLLVFAIGFRLLPRFLVVHPPRPLVGLVLPMGALGPLVLAYSLPTGQFITWGAISEGIAIVGFAIAYLYMLNASDRNRVGFYGPFAGGVFGVVAVSLGLYFALGSRDASLALLHLRLNLLGFIGLTIIGIAYQFYPPNIGSLWGVNNRTALASLTAIVFGLGLASISVLGSYWGVWVIGQHSFHVGGRIFALVGTILYGYLITALFYERYWS